jgi:hypothetical protein
MKMDKGEVEEPHDKGGIPHIHHAQADDGDDDSPAAQLEQMVLAHIKRTGEKNKSKAYDAVRATPEGAQLMEHDKQACLRKNASM